MSRYQDEHGGMIVQITENREAYITTQQNAVHLDTPIMKTRRDHLPRYPKRFPLIFSIIQLGIASLAIITQLVIETQVPYDEYGRCLPIGIRILGTGFWCGILFGLSGASGIAASFETSCCKSEKSCIIVNMIVSVVSIFFGFTLFTISSIGTGAYQEYYSDSTIHAMFAIPMAISIIQIMASSLVFAISSRAICNCCNYVKPLKKIFPKTTMKVLSLIQLFIAILIIIMEIAVMSSNYKVPVGMNNPYFEGSIMPLSGGIWCGVIIGLSGVTGIIASSDPSSLKLLIFMVFDLIAALFCLPLITFASIGVSIVKYNYNSTTENVLCVTTLALVVFEVILTMLSLSLACLYLCDCCRPNEEPRDCKHITSFSTNEVSTESLPPTAPLSEYNPSTTGQDPFHKVMWLSLCDCCRPNKEPGIVYYSNNHNNNIRNGSNIQSNFGTPSGYHAVPMRRMENLSYSNDCKHHTPFTTNEVSAESFAPSAPMIDDNPIPA